MNCRKRPIIRCWKLFTTDCLAMISLRWVVLKFLFCYVLFIMFIGKYREVLKTWNKRWLLKQSTFILQLIRCLEILTGLCTFEGNEALIGEFLNRRIFDHIFQTIGVKDIMLCVYTLECLYQVCRRLTMNLLCKCYIVNLNGTYRCYHPSFNDFSLTISLL